MKVGTIVDDRYRVRGIVGRGAMALVYAATDLRLNRTVALKAAHVGGDTDSCERNRHEVRALTSLDHPNVVHMLDAGCSDGVDYLVLEFVDGPSLAARLREGPLPLGAATRLLGETASALAYLHARGIVHRDLKPANILLDRAGHAHVADFGTAWLLDGTRLTATGESIGTASYLSPEQVRGHGITPPTDVYALGLVFLECLTGRREYDGTPAEAAVARSSRPPTIDAAVPAPWASRVAQMTALDPAARPTAADVAGWVADSPDPLIDGAADTIALPLSPVATAAVATAALPTRGAPQERRRAWVQAAVGVAAAATAVAAAGMFWPSSAGGPRTGSSSAAPPSTSAAPALDGSQLAAELAANRRAANATNSGSSAAATPTPTPTHAAAPAPKPAPKPHGGPAGGHGPGHGHGHG